MGRSEGGPMKSMNAKAVTTRQEFQEFLEFLVLERTNHPDQWGNSTLPSFLEAMAGFTADLEGFFAQQGDMDNAESATWSVFAQILAAAKVYE
ncbi:MAG: hypothetical protein KUG77_02085 [Nannocystaceae bacterium]|nr:hypothetical protein [Nannocystaceae bacterium]